MHVDPAIARRDAAEAQQANSEAQRYIDGARPIDDDLRKLHDRQLQLLGDVGTKANSAQVSMRASLSH